MNDQYLIDLETKISHQEIAIEELKQTVFDQHNQLERLEKTLKVLTERIDSRNSGPEIGPANEKPPHY
jgi:SlyX protein